MIRRDRRAAHDARVPQGGCGQRGHDRYALASPAVATGHCVMSRGRYADQCIRRGAPCAPSNRATRHGADHDDAPHQEENSVRKAMESGRPRGDHLGAPVRACLSHRPRPWMGARANGHRPHDVRSRAEAHGGDVCADPRRRCARPEDGPASGDGSRWRDAYQASSSHRTARDRPRAVGGRARSTSSPAPETYRLGARLCSTLASSGRCPCAPSTEDIASAALRHRWRVSKISVAGASRRGQRRCSRAAFH